MQNRSGLRVVDRTRIPTSLFGVFLLLAAGVGTSQAADGTYSGALPSDHASATPPLATTSAAVTPVPQPVAPPSASSPTTQPVATSAAEDATGKPPASAIRDAASSKKHLAVRATRKAKAKVDIAAVAPSPPPEQPSFLDALFGKSMPGAPTPAEPMTTGATDQVGGDATNQPKSKHGKAVKSAKSTVDAPPPAETAIPDAGLFSGDDAPFASADLGYPLLSPNNIEPLKTAIKRYGDIVSHKGWPTVPPLQMEVGTNNPAVTVLRQRLAIEGDLTAQPTGLWGGDYFDEELAAAVKRFQDRYGLSATGDLMDADRLKNGTRTVMALNVPAEARLAQLKANLSRMQSQIIAKGRYVLVNIPGEQIEAVENNKVALRLNGVVGRPERKSPLLSSNIEEVKFNPTWTLPPTVVKEDLIPKGQSLQSKGVDVLAKFGIDAYDGSGKKIDTSKINWASATASNLRFMQQPGKDNPLGFAKLDFASPESVYMHDTPSSKLFDKSYRAASSGCIRVDHMEYLATWLLKDTDGWSQARVLGMKQSGVSQIVRLKKAVPLHWVYITAWATEDGVVHFRRDLYSKDQAFGVSQTASAY